MNLNESLYEETFLENIYFIKKFGKLQILLFLENIKFEENLFDEKLEISNQSKFCYKFYYWTKF